ncbi:hypothetical protein D3C77_643610 [compost metagenome]
MVDRLDLPGLQYFQQAISIADRPENRHQPGGKRLPLDSPLQLHMNAVQVELAMLEQQQRFRRVR